MPLFLKNKLNTTHQKLGLYPGYGSLSGSLVVEKNGNKWVVNIQWR